ncbi:MAG TPA: hypothetical protein PLR25_22345, partial [Planctomycetaceae bacterium]|nr:hypothetical protein [Planctomycetaceae bacterium]
MLPLPNEELNKQLIASLGRGFRSGPSGRREIQVLQEGELLSLKGNDRDVTAVQQIIRELESADDKVQGNSAPFRQVVIPSFFRPSIAGIVPVPAGLGETATTRSGSADWPFINSAKHGSLALNPGDLADPQRIYRGSSRRKVDHLLESGPAPDQSSIDWNEYRQHRWSAASPQNPNELVVLPTFHAPTSNSLVANPALFGDLLSHAPGLNTLRADVLAVLEAESPAGISDLKSQISNAKLGRIDDAARLLIEKAHGRGWESITLPGGCGEAGITIHYDGAGRHVWERVVSEGLREHVVCNGSTLWHIYRDIGLASKRPFSRLHHAEFTKIVPWLLPSVEDLARGADVVAIDERTVAIVPIVSGKAPAAGNICRLIFAADGRLVERRFLHSETSKLLLRTTYVADGTITAFDDAGKELGAVKLNRSIAAAPSLMPELTGLVVLPMPIRTVEHVGRSVPDRQPSASQQQSTLDAGKNDVDEGHGESGLVADLGQVGLQVGRFVPNRQPSASQQQSTLDAGKNDVDEGHGESG